MRSSQKDVKIFMPASFPKQILPLSHNQGDLKHFNTTFVNSIFLSVNIDEKPGRCTALPVVAPLPDPPELQTD